MIPWSNCCLMFQLTDKGRVWLAPVCLINRRIQQTLKEIVGTADIISIEVTPHTLRHTRAVFLAED